MDPKFFRKYADIITEAEQLSELMQTLPVCVPAAGNTSEIVQLTDVNGLEDFRSRWSKASMEKQAEYGYDDPAVSPDGVPVSPRDGEGLLFMTYNEWYDSIPEHDPKKSTR